MNNYKPLPAIKHEHFLITFVKDFLSLTGEIIIMLAIIGILILTLFYAYVILHTYALI